MLQAHYRTQNASIHFQEVLNELFSHDVNWFFASHQNSRWSLTFLWLLQLVKFKRSVGRKNVNCISHIWSNLILKIVSFLCKYYTTHSYLDVTGTLLHMLYQNKIKPFFKVLFKTKYWGEIHEVKWSTTSAAVIVERKLFCGSTFLLFLCFILFFFFAVSVFGHWLRKLHVNCSTADNKRQNNNILRATSRATACKTSRQTSR